MISFKIELLKQGFVVSLIRGSGHDPDMRAYGENDLDVMLEELHTWIDGFLPHNASEKGG
jgi:hypothetical protein